MKQNKYDDPEFFARYSEMPRSIEGLAGAGEWPAFQTLLPDLHGKRVLDLGCGFGWHCRYVREQGAHSVVGVDISEKMIDHAKAGTDDPGIEYRCSAIEDIDFSAEAFDLVISSLAVHYVERFDVVCHHVHRWLKTDGTFVFSAEHPMFTARAEQAWCVSPGGELLHWPVDDYGKEGLRQTQWLTGNVIKYHRTVATYVNTLIDAGFRLRRLVEPMPTAKVIAQHPDWKDECRRPMFILLLAGKGEPIGKERR